MYIFFKFFSFLVLKFGYPPNLFDVTHMVFLFRAAEESTKMITCTDRMLEYGRRGGDGYSDVAAHFIV